MRNLLILGTGRSGTSMVAALFRKSGAYLGDNLLSARIGNPFGYYEDPDINRLNADVIAQILARSWTTRFLPWTVHPIHRRAEASWLAAPWHLPRIQPDARATAAMRAKLARQPFCLKDPRFCVTLPTWRPLLPPDTRYLVVFRDPQRTADSMLRDSLEREDDPLPIDALWAAVLWWRTYRRLLRDLSRTGDWLFVHYDDVLSGAALPAISAFTAVSVDAQQLDPSVSRAQPTELQVGRRWTRRCAQLYQELRERAAEDLARYGPAHPMANSAGVSRARRDSQLQPATNP
jgi:hypothetical protein